MNNYTAIVTNKVLSAINDNNMLGFRDEVVVGFSGGADSVCLLHVLFSLSKSLGFVVKAAHVNHGIRGDEAKRDEDFSADFCSRYGIDFYSHTFDCKAEAKQTGESLEECGRRIRYDYFNSLVGECGKIATAHNANDNAETVIFNLARGTALKGACGIPCVRDNIIRPLLYCTRQEIELYCKENNLDYVTDSTNLSDDYSRNKIRHKILPVLAELNSCAIENISSFCIGARQTENYIHSEAEERLYSATVSKDTYDVTFLRNCPTALLKEVVCVAYESFSEKSLDRQKIEAIISLIYNSGRLQLYGNEYVEVVKNKLRFFRKTSYESTDILSVSGIGEYNFGTYKLTIKKFTDCSTKTSHSVLLNSIDCDKINGKLFLRTRCEGDKITLFKRNVTKSLKKVFCEYNVPIENRNTIPILCDDDGIVWVYGIGTTARCCVDDNSSNIIYIEGENNG